MRRESVLPGPAAAPGVAVAVAVSPARVGAPVLRRRWRRGTAPAVGCSMSSYNCCVLTCMQVSQETGKVVWCSHVLNKFPQFVVIYTVEGFRIINKAEVDVFLEFSCFFYDPTDVGNLISGFSAFPKSSLNIWKFTVHVLLKPGMENFEH